MLLERAYTLFGLSRSVVWNSPISHRKYRVQIGFSYPGNDGDLVELRKAEGGGMAALLCSQAGPEEFVN